MISLLNTRRTKPNSAHRAKHLFLALLWPKNVRAFIYSSLLPPGGGGATSVLRHDIVFLLLRAPREASVGHLARGYTPIWAHSLSSYIPEGS